MTEVTCWTLVHGAADGDGDARSLFARTYLPVVRAYLAARWKGGPHVADIDDAVQESFVECFRAEGALGKADPDKAGKFRTFLFAVVRNVARRMEEKRAVDRARRAASAIEPGDIEDHGEHASQAFDRAWAEALLRRAAERQAEAARANGERALRRVELMRLRFAEDKPIREIAKLWNEDAADLHHEYAKAREEFKAALHAEVAFHHPGNAGEIERECEELLGLL
jgi:RNA polymerase sigma factor (sigma-70 family)